MAKARASFRNTVLARIEQAGVRGVERERLMDEFANQPRVKVTIALNELVARQKVYFRHGIYRLWRSVETA